MYFKNRAGSDPDNNVWIKEELRLAGIPQLVNDDLDGEVKTNVFGMLHGWMFHRAWNYWICVAPDNSGIPTKEAEELYSLFSKDLRLDGDCSCPHPSVLHGKPCRIFHADTQEALKALADMIRKLNNEPEKEPVAPKTEPNPQVSLEELEAREAKFEEGFGELMKGLLENFVEGLSRLQKKRREG